MANVAELALLFKAEGADTVDKAVEGVSSKLSGLGKIGDGLAGGLVNVGKIAAVGVAGIATAAVGVGGALLAVGGQFDDAFDGMAVKTGATGQALEGLQDSFKNVIGNTPADFETVSAAMGTLSQRTGATGKELETLTTQVADLSRITGVDATAAATAAADVFAKWGTTGADQGKVMDQLFVASQQTGIGFEDLAASVTTNASALQAGGLGMRESIGLISNLKSAGIDASEVMPKLGKAMAKMVKEGKDPAEGLSALFDTIKAEGPNSAAAIEALGPAGLKLAAGIASGKVELGAFSEALASSSGAISDTAADTADFGERMDMMKNKLMVAFEPMGSKVMDLVTKFTDAMLPIVERVGWAISDLSDGDFIAFLEDIGFSLETAKEYGYPLIEMFDELKTVFADSGGGIDGLVGMFDLLGEKLGLISAGDAGSAFQSIKEAIMGIDWAGIGETVMTFAGYFMDGLGVILPIIADIFQNVLLPVLTTVFGFLMDHKETLLAVGAAFLILTNPIAAVVAAIMAIGAIVPMITGWWAEATAGTSAAWDGILAYIAGIWDGITTGISDAISAVGQFIDAGWNGFLVIIQGIQDAIYNYLIGIWLAIPADIRADLELIAAHMVEKWTEIKDIITDKIEAARVLISAKWDAIREYLDAKLAQISAAVAAIWDAISSKIADVMKAVQGKIDEAWSWIDEKIHNALNSIQDVFNNVMDWISDKTGVSMDAIKGYFDDAITVVHDIVDVFIAWFKGDWEGMFDAIQRVADNAWAAVKNIFSDAWAKIKEVLKIDELVDKFKAGMSALEKVGADIVAGLKQGIANAWDGLKEWFANKIRELLGDIKGLLGIKSPSKVMADEVGEPMALGIVMGMQAGLSANPIVGIVEDWTKALRPGEVAKLITPVLGSGIGAAISKAISTAIPELVSSDPAWGTSGALGSLRSSRANAKGTGWSGLNPGGMGNKADDGRVRADAFHSGKGGHLAASSSNYWQVFVAKWGVPTEASARKVSRQLGIPLPQWLLDIYNPPQGETVDAPDVLKDPAPAMEAGHALEHLAKVAQEVADALKAVPVRFALEVEKAAGIIGNAMGNFIPSPGDSNPRMRPLPPGGIGGPIVIDPPGGTSTFGAGGGYGTGSVMLATQTVNLAGPVNVGFTGTFQVGGGRSLAVELVDALIADTGTFDKLIRAEDNRRAQKP